MITLPIIALCVVGAAAIVAVYDIVHWLSERAASREMEINDDGQE